MLGEKHAATPFQSHVPNEHTHNKLHGIVTKQRNNQFHSRRLPCFIFKR